MTDNHENNLKSAKQNSDPQDARSQTPVYQKPVLRKYDQIEQVKPYGPSELEAG